jgi:hypothetical protein
VVDLTACAVISTPDGYHVSCSFALKQAHTLIQSATVLCEAHISNFISLSVSSTNTRKQPGHTDRQSHKEVLSSLANSTMPSLTNDPIDLPVTRAVKPRLSEASAAAWAVRNCVSVRRATKGAGQACHCPDTSGRGEIMHHRYTPWGICKP